jgi:hypothetical protein
MAQFEWIIIEVIVLGVLVWQFVSIRRAVKIDREKAKALKEGKESTP